MNSSTQFIGITENVENIFELAHNIGMVRSDSFQKLI